MIGGLPEKLKTLRLQYGYSQRRVAKILNISPSIVSSYETGERTPSTDALLLLSNLYRCSTDYLLGRDKTEPKIYKILDVEGLTAEQINALQELVDTIRK